MENRPNGAPGAQHDNESSHPNEAQRSLNNAAGEDPENTELPAASELDRMVRTETVADNSEQGDNRLPDGQRAARNTDSSTEA